MIRAAIMAVILPFYVAQTISVADVPEIREEPVQIQQETEEPYMEYVGDYRVTAYAYYEGGGENYSTASGATPVPYYTVATGSEFDFGTVLYIDGIGEVEVQDRGGFDAGIIDLHIGYDSMESFEDRYRAVYIVHY